MKRLATVAVATLVASFAVPSSGAAAAPVKECGDYAPGGGAGVSNITTRVTSCSRARRMARRFYHGQWGPISRGTRPFRRGAYVCRNRQLASELFDLRCRASGGRVVRWQHGA